MWVSRVLPWSALVIVFAFVPPAAATPDVRIAEKAALQAAMQRHIDRTLVSRAYLHLDSKTGEITSLYPVAAHPNILRMGRFFVLCSDFLDGNGNEVNVDFYLARRGRNYVVFAEEVGNRQLISRLQKAGKITRLD